MKQNRLEAAKDTLSILEKGMYTVNGKEIDISKALDNAMQKTTLYYPEDTRLEDVQIESKYECTIEVYNETTIEAIQVLSKETNDKIGVLNFASAKNPGGGFLGGAQAQEESLARSSSLYNGLIQHEEMYKFNKSRRTYLYSDYMIYSADTVVFKDDHLRILEEPIIVDMLTSPAVNLGAIRNNKPSEEKELEQVMLVRMDKVLTTFALNGSKVLVLGAWGCGVFRNDPEKIAAYFNHFLGEGGKFYGAFKHVRFAVLDTKDRGIHRAFEKQFLNS